MNTPPPQIPSHYHGATHDEIMQKLAALRACPHIIATHNREVGFIEAHLSTGQLVFRALQKGAKNWIVREASGLFESVK